MSRLLICAFLLIVSIDLSKCSSKDCEVTQRNGKNGFCVSNNCCEGLSDSNYNLCGNQGVVCCFGNFKCSSQSSTSRNQAGTSGCPPTYNKQSWKGLPPRRPLKDLAPVSDVFIHHTNDGYTCEDNNACSLRMRSLQSYHQLTKKWDDIAWNFVIGGDGQVYEGIGWKKQGFHTFNWNNRSLGIALIGSYNDQTQELYDILDPMLDALDNLLTCGVNQGYIKSGYRLHGHRDVVGINTKCPGDFLYNLLNEQFNSFVTNRV